MLSSSKIQQCLNRSEITICQSQISAVDGYWREDGVGGKCVNKLQWEANWENILKLTLRKVTCRKINSEKSKR